MPVLYCGRLLRFQSASISASCHRQPAQSPSHGSQHKVGQTDRACVTDPGSLTDGNAWEAVAASGRMGRQRQSSLQADGRVQDRADWRMASANGTVTLTPSSC